MYNYNEKDVYKTLNKDAKRKMVIYKRVSTPKRYIDLLNEIEHMMQWLIGSTPF